MQLMDDILTYTPELIEKKEVNGSEHHVVFESAVLDQQGHRYRVSPPTYRTQLMFEQKPEVLLAYAKNDGHDLTL
jgi:hypothetical protein